MDVTLEQLGILCCMYDHLRSKGELPTHERYAGSQELAEQIMSEMYKECTLLDITDPYLQIYIYSTYSKLLENKVSMLEDDVLYLEEET